MIKFKRKKTFSLISSIIFFASMSILAISIGTSNTSNLVTPSYATVGLSNSQFTQQIVLLFVSNEQNFMWWLALIIFMTLVGFLIGRLMDNCVLPVIIRKYKE